MPHILALLPTTDLYGALALLAAPLYETSSFLVHKLTQLDLSFAAMTAPPLLLRPVRMTRREMIGAACLGMVAVSGLLVVFTVLQEIAHTGQATVKSC